MTAPVERNITTLPTVTLGVLLQQRQGLEHERDVLAHLAGLLEAKLEVGAVANGRHGHQALDGDAVLRVRARLATMLGELEQNIDQFNKMQVLSSAEHSSATTSRTRRRRPSERPRGDDR
jgi:hypothetical protein